LAGAWWNRNSRVPHFYVTSTYKMEKVMELRKQLNAYLPDDQKLTVNDFIIKAVALNAAPIPATSMPRSRAMKSYATGTSILAAP
jgi:pyruvate/2-oxoglutarate dehydrogenase complex dihydrolipoamide acyltransferase (E2) component